MSDRLTSGDRFRYTATAIYLSAVMAVTGACAAEVPVGAGVGGTLPTTPVEEPRQTPKLVDSPVVVKDTVTAEPVSVTNKPEVTLAVGATGVLTDAVSTENEAAVEIPTNEPEEQPEPSVTPNETATLEAEAGGPPTGGVGGAPEGGTQPEPGVGVDVQADPVIPVVDEGYFEIEGIKVFGSWQDAGVLEVRPQGDGSVIVNDGEVDPSTLEKAYKFPGTDKVAYSNNVVEFKFKITGDGGEKLTIYNVLAQGTLMAIVRNGDATYLVVDCGGTKWGFPTSEYTKFYKHDALKEDLTSDTELLGFGEEGMVNLSDPNGGSEVIVSLQYNGPNNNGKGLVDEGMTEVYELEEPAGGKP